MKIFKADFKGPTKVPNIIEEKVNALLSKGGLKAVNVCESQGGRLYFSVYVDENAPAKTSCKVFRNHIAEKLQEDINQFLATDVVLKFSHESVSAHSNILHTVLFYEPKKQSEKS